MGVSTRAAWAYILVPGINKIIMDKYAKMTKEYEAIFNVEGTEKAVENELTVTGLSSMPTKSEGDDVVFYDMYQGYYSTYTVVTYAMGFQVTYEAYKDDKYKIFTPRVSMALGKSAANAKDVACANILNRAFSGDYLGADGKALCADDHPLKGGGTEQNVPSSPYDMTVSGLTTGLSDFEDTTDDQGLPSLIPPKFIICKAGTTAAKKAKEIVGSDKSPHDATNAINIYKGSLQVIENHFLTDANATFISGDKADHNLRLYERELLRTEGDDDFKSGNALYKALQRFIAGWGDFRGWYGSQGK